MKYKPMPKWMRRILGRYYAITLAPFGIYIRNDYFDDIETRKHETIHWSQQMEMLIVFFYIWYLLEWLIKIPFYGGGAYMAISFEREAYSMPEKRKRFGWMKYIFKKL